MTVLVLHGTWAPDGDDGPVVAGPEPGEGRFFVWAERVPAGRRGRRPTSGPKDGAPHPFQARPEEVRDAAVMLSPVLARQLDRGTWHLVRRKIRLPSRSDTPLHSPEAARLVAALVEADAEVATSEARRKAEVSRAPAAAASAPAVAPAGSAVAPVLASWQVRGVAFEAFRAVQLLASLPVDGQLELPGVQLGADLRFWSAVAKLILELLARQRLVPTLERVERNGHPAASGRTHAMLSGGYAVSWRPVLDDPRDVQRLEALVRSMPPIARALHTNGEAELSSARDLLESFVETSVDALARTWLAADAGRRTPASSSPSVSWAWLEALRRGERGVRASSFDLEHLAARLAEWRAPLVTAASSSAYRTGFRLEPPDVEGSPPAARAAGEPSDTPRLETAGDWSLQIFLQATDDPSLMLPAEEVWREQGSTLVYLNRRFDQPQERLLADLARAARAFPPLDRCLNDPRPTACTLDTEEAFEFLREGAWLLEENGFGVLVPNWWDRRGPRGRLGLRLSLRPAGSGESGSGGRGAGLGDQALVEYDWRLAVGDVELSEAEFRQLAALKVPLVCVRGQWVELRPDKIEQAITFWEKQKHAAPTSVAEVLPIALGAEDVGGLPLLGVEAEGWVGRLLGQTEAIDGETPTDGIAPARDGAQLLQPLAAPPGFVGELRPYQERGVGWLTFLSDRGLGACLADDMGLGKTIQYIAFLQHRRLRLAEEARNGSTAAAGRNGSVGPGPALLICPTSVVGNWRRELERFGPDLRVLVHHGAGRMSGAAFAAAAREQDLVITSYALVHRDRASLAALQWDGVVLDEAQNVKNATTLQARAVRTIPARYRFALTGTPIENRLTELWSIIDFLNPGYLGSQHGFRQRFVTPIERWQDQDRAEQLRRLVLPLVLRRLKTDPSIIRDLPEKHEMTVYCTLTPEQATLYQAVVNEMLARVESSEGIERRGLVLATLTRLKQVCNHPAHFLADGSALAGRSGKLERLQEMLEEVIEAGDRALVFTQFAEMGARLREHLQVTFGREVLFLHGGVPAAQRDAMVARFQQERGGPPVFVLSLRAGGVGLNLTQASHVFHFDRWWNPAVENQATDRAFRIGQQRNVQVHKFVCAGTLEEKIDALIESKRALAEQVVGSGESWLTELTTAELRDLLTLRAEAVVD